MESPAGFVRAAIYGYTVDKNIGFAVIKAGKAVIGEKVTVGKQPLAGCNHGQMLAVS